MELWIRSQDKKRLIKATNIYLDEEIEYNDEKYTIKCGTIDIGYYTYNRGFEVLDEIQELIQPSLICTEYHSEIKEFNKTEFQVVMQPNEQKLEYIHPQIIVYQMPKE